MNEHQLDSLEFRGNTGWVATCTCHNPDGDGFGRADFPGESAYEAYLGWDAHRAAQEPKLPTRPTLNGDFVTATATGLDFEHGEVSVRTDMYGVVITLSGRTGTAWLHITPEDWNKLRQYRA